MPEKKLSILICHKPDRRVLLDQLKISLAVQDTHETEVLVDELPGEVGAKRNRLLDQSTGRYITYVDDDDKVSEDYVSRILAAINTEPDVVGIQGEITTNGANPWLFRHSISVERWCKDKQAKIYFRMPNHLNPVKREFALQTRFDDNKSWGEDRDYSERLKPLLKSEVFIDATIYHYLCRR